MIVSGVRNMSERIPATGTVAAATDLVTEETSTTGRGTGQSPRQGGETENARGQTLEEEGGGTERGQAPPPGGGGRGRAHTGGTDPCPPETGGRDTDNDIMLENKWCKYMSCVTITCVTFIIEKV